MLWHRSVVSLLSQRSQRLLRSGMDLRNCLLTTKKDNKNQTLSKGVSRGVPSHANPKDSRQRSPWDLWGKDALSKGLLPKGPMDSFGGSLRGGEESCGPREKIKWKNTGNQAGSKRIQNLCQSEGFLWKGIPSDKNFRSAILLPPPAAQVFHGNLDLYPLK